MHGGRGRTCWLAECPEISRHSSGVAPRHHGGFLSWRTERIQTLKLPAQFYGGGRPRTCTCTHLSTAPMVNPGGRVVGRSLREWTTRSTLRDRQETRSHTHTHVLCSSSTEPGRPPGTKGSLRRRRHSLVPLQGVLQLFGEQALLPDLHQRQSTSGAFLSCWPSRAGRRPNAALPLTAPCPGFCPRWLTWQLEHRIQAGCKSAAATSSSPGGLGLTDFDAEVRVQFLELFSHAVRLDAGQLGRNRHTSQSFTRPSVRLSPLHSFIHSFIPPLTRLHQEPPP